MADQGEITFSMRLENPNEIMQAFRAYLPKLTQEEALDLWQDLEDLMAIIKEDYVPIEFGDLRDSGYVNAPELGPDGFEIEIGFDSEYALIQHERLDYNHPHGQAKYLEQPLMEYLGIRLRG